MIRRTLDRLADHAAAILGALAQGRHDEAAKLMADNLTLTFVCRRFGMLDALK